MRLNRTGDSENHVISLPPLGFSSLHTLSSRFTPQPETHPLALPSRPAWRWAEFNDQPNLRRKVMNNVYVLIIHGGQPGTETDAPLEITGSPRQHKLSIRSRSAFALQQAKAKLSPQNTDARKVQQGGCGVSVSLTAHAVKIQHL